MQQIGVHGKRRFAALVLRHRNLVLLGEVEQRVAALEFPFPPRSDNADIRLQRVIAQLKAHLIVALAGRAMTHGIRAGFPCDFNLALGDQRAGNRRAEQVNPLVKRVRAEHRKHVVADEFFAQIFNVNLFDAQHFGLAARRFQLVALTEIGGKGDDLAIVSHLKPLQNDGGIEAAGIGENDLLYVGHDLRFLYVRAARQMDGL